VTAVIRPAQPGDEAEITTMIYELATFEHSVDQCTVTETQMRTALFGPTPTAHAHVAEVGGRIAAGAVWYISFSTWDGQAGIYLEDLFVRPAFRRRGLARALMRELASICVASGYSRLTWAVLNWNADAIALYDEIGGTPLSEWTSYRVSGSSLSALAESD
jgi:GNAT superfamily N-acetyltransferase